MKIAFNIYPLQSAHKTRGIGYYTYNLLEELKKRDDLEVLEFTDISQVKQADVVHYPWFDLFFKTLKLNKIPTIVTVHDTMPLVFPKEYPVGLKGKINFYFQKRALKKCKQIITVSKCSQKDISKYLNIPKEKISIIPEAANEAFRVLSDALKLSIKRKYKLPDNFLLYVGDANFVKNLPFLIDGFNILKEKFPDLKLILVGGVFLKKPDSIDHPELKSLKELFQRIDRYNLSDDIIRPGQIDISALVGFYNLATVYVQPSLYEGLGLPILEAFACGTPVVSSNTSSLPEIGGDAACYFDPNNLSKFTSVLGKLLEDKELRLKMSRLGLQRIKLFSWKGVADATIATYKKAINK